MVITISREYGAYGRSVAKALSRKLGIEYYDVDFVRLTAQISGYSEDEVRREGEDLRNGEKFFNSFSDTYSRQRSTSSKRFISYFFYSSWNTDGF